MKKIVLVTFLASITAACGAVESQSTLSSTNRVEDIEKSYRAVKKFANECGLAEMTVVSRDSINRLPSFSKLVNKAQTKARQMINTNGMREDEVFGAANHGFWREHVVLTNKTKDRQKSCAARAGRFERSFDRIAGVLATGKTGEQAYAYAMAKKFGGKKVIFYIASRPTPDFANFKVDTVGISADEVEVRHEVAYLSDAELQAGLTNGDLDFGRHGVKHVRQLAISRQLMMTQIPWFVELIDSENSGWRLIKGFLPNGGETMLVKYEDLDDNSYSFFFHPRTETLDHVYYEN